jgi:lipopolysaccharide/colanic/teichoic acid biosynthesis glycosyltransferase
MKPTERRKGQYIAALLDLCACVLGYGIGAWIGSLGAPQPTLGWWIYPALVSALIAWFALAFPESQWHEGMRLWADSFLAMIGSNLLVQAGLLYLFGILPASWFVIFAGSALTVAAAALLRAWDPFDLSDKRAGILFLGCDLLTAPLATALPQPIVGALDTGSAGIPGVPFRGQPECLSAVYESTCPGAVVVSGTIPEISLRELLDLHYSGVQVEGADLLYERVCDRVAWECLKPSDLLFFLNPDTSHALLAFQAIYKNIIGLGLMLVCAPLITLLSLLIILFQGGPAQEHIECMGLQRTPFQLLRFRIRRNDGSQSWIGKLIYRLGLTNLPNLINIVRGEMVLFGPAPHRMEFANRLCQLLPAYEYRFTVKPGVFGLARVKDGIVPEEIERLELDLYYIKHESPSLDLSILFEVMFRRSESGIKPVFPRPSSDL